MSCVGPLVVLFLAFFTNTLSAPHDYNAELVVEKTPRHDLSLLRYLLWTRSNPEDEDYYILIPDDLENLENSNFNGALNTYMIHPGLTTYGDDPWIVDSKTSLLTLFDCNVISVDWGYVLADPYRNHSYTEEMETMYLVAEMNANLIDWLVNVTELTPSKIEMAGHSLGGQSAGMTAKYVTTGKIKRVTGLDPAGPGFYNKTSEDSLDKSQAEFVDIIHTNAGPAYDGCYGIWRPIGHVDFYPDGGVHQDGCLPPGNVTGSDLIELLNDCSHQRAPKYWLESIQYAVNSTGSLDFASWPCPDWESFENANCTSCGQGCLNMGFNVQRNLEGTYYLNTASRPPFAMGNDQGL